MNKLLEKLESLIKVSGDLLYNTFDHHNELVKHLDEFKKALSVMSMGIDLIDPNSVASTIIDDTSKILNEIVPEIEKANNALNDNNNLNEQKEQQLDAGLY